MSTLQMTLAAVVVSMLLAWLWLKRRGPGATLQVEKLADRIDTVIGWPPQATRVLSTPERVAFGTLTRALPEYMVLAQVPLSRFISVPKRNSYADWLRRVGYQCVDFVICDMSAQVVAVVELQAPQLSDRARKRTVRIARTLKAAQLPLHVWSENALPSAEVARDVLLLRADSIVSTPASSKLSPAAASTAATTAAATTPPAESRRSPFEDTDRDSTQDEMIELLEPPPSTWFDEFDSDSVPLDKR